MLDHDDSIDKRLAEQKDKTVNMLVVGMTLLGLIGLPFSLSRFLYTGWQISYSMHSCGFLILALLFIFRHKLPTQFKLHTIVVLAFLISVLDLMIQGLFGNGILWGAFTLMLCFHFYNLRKIIIGVGIFFVVYWGCAYNFVTLGQTFSGDPNIYLSQLTAWGSAFFGSAIFVVLIASLVKNQKNQMNALALMLENKNRQIVHMANHDILTELPTIRLASERLNLAIELAKRKKHKVALMFLDLDGFKLINDKHGHDAGDEVLIQVSNRLSSVIRKSDTACRIGGDEFLIVLSEVTRTEEIKEICERLLKQIKKKIIFRTLSLKVSVSVGVALYPDNASNASNLRKKADKLMYTVKNSGKNNYIIASKDF